MKLSGSGSGSGPGPTPAPSPSFNEYSSGSTAEIAARVVSELAPDTDYYCHDRDDVALLSAAAHCQNDAFHQPENGVVADETKPENLEEEEEEDDDSSFEFPVPGRGENFSPVSADEIFNNGQIVPLFPVFNTDLVYADTDWRDAFNFDGGNCSIHSPAAVMEENSDFKLPEKMSIRLPLKKLMISERVTSVMESASCSSSEADELEGVAPDTYCVWNPSKEEMRKKSKSMGTSKRWKIRDLLYRSSSEGADAFVFLTSKLNNYQKKAPATRKPRDSEESSRSEEGRKKQGEAVTMEKAPTEHYTKSKAIGEIDRKRSFSPNRHDPAGFFSRMNGLSRTIQPF